MTSPTPDRRIRALSILFMSAPLGFALIRAFRTGRDLRYLWVALASLLGAASIVAIGGACIHRPRRAAVLFAAAFVSATLLAVLAAWLLGTRVGPGILVVALSFGFCSATGGVLQAAQRNRGPVRSRMPRD